MVVVFVGFARSVVKHIFLLFVLLIFVLQFSSSSRNQRKGKEKTQERGEREDRVYVTVLQTIWE